MPRILFSRLPSDPSTYPCIRQAQESVLIRKTYRALNGLRFFAALAVVAYHYVPTYIAFDKLPMFMQNLVYAGPIALGFFYILSGFILTEAYRDRLPQSASARKKFWWARVARLYPVYLLAFVMFIPMAFEKFLHHPNSVTYDPHAFWWGGILSLVALQSWTPFAQAWNGPSWSLSVEAFFYFIFPFVVLKVLKARRSFLLPVIAVLWLLMLSLPWMHATGKLNDEVWKTWIQNNPLFWTPLFIMGIALARLATAWEKVSKGVVFLMAMTSLTLLIMLCGLLSTSSVAVLIFGGAAPLLALIVLAFSHSTSASSRLFGTKILFNLGAASFVTYILQAPIWHILEHGVAVVQHKAVDKHSTSAWLIIVYLIVLIAASFLVQAVVERPIQQWLLNYKRTKKNSEMDRPVDPGIEAV